jgi:hypothetical protein
MQNKAVAAGLAIDPTEISAPVAANYLAPVTDSYREFLDGAYALTHPPYYRSLTLGPGSNEMLDQSASDKKTADSTYRPRNTGFPT